MELNLRLRAAAAKLAALVAVGLLVAIVIAPASAGERASAGDLGASFRRYQQAPLPGWVKYQWLSWYAVGMSINEEYLKSQIDYIAENLADLGPWHILVDAGWYVSEGRPDADWRNVDAAKFPSGLRALVDYAHSRGIRVVLYLALPYLDDSPTPGNWLGLRGIIDSHPDWLIPLGRGSNGDGYLLDFGKQQVREYFAVVLHDFLAEYDVDGIKVDGFGDADREVKAAIERGLFTEEDAPSLQSAEIFEFIHETAVSIKSDVYIEAGWFPPVSARSHVHTVRYGDEYPAFEYPYPSGGLRQHVDYSLIQRSQLGERPNIGAIWGDSNEVSIGYQWLEAGLALSSQVVLGFDLPSMSPEVLSGYRSRLAQYNAFQAEPRVGGGSDPDTFVSVTNGTAYVGVINRDATKKIKTVDLAAYGLNPHLSYLVYDVISDSFFRASGSLSFEVQPGRFRLFFLRDEVGVVWTNASFEQTFVPGRMTIALKGPASLTGFVDIHTPPFAGVFLDGVQLTADQYRFDSVNNVLTLVFGFDGPREVRIVY
ncbi:MAG: alpha-galactosidase [Chloroflexi bacterium]|nr:alpha-galactosidase [Chloroflexota bacterium]